MTSPWNEIAGEIYDGAIRDDDNNQRAARALLAVYPSYDDEGIGDAIHDILCDIRHLCDLAGLDFDAENAFALRTYQHERDERGKAQHTELAAAIKEQLT